MNYVVEFKSKYISPVDYNECLIWLRNNIGAGGKNTWVWVLTEQQGNFDSIVFENEEDATAFRLRFKL